jgi:fructose-bisphosphate aldolase class I
MNSDQIAKIQSGKGFIAALDQSGGSSPKALEQYGIASSKYSSEAEMFDLIHAMRSRIIVSPAFSGERIVGAILFEMTMDRKIEDIPTVTYLWERKNVVPFLKIDKGLADEENDVQLMKPIPGLEELLSRAKTAGIFGTKMRSVIKLANAEGIKSAVDQQFEVASQILAHQLVPIIEPEIDIHSPEKSEAEAMLKSELLSHLDNLEPGQVVMLKLTLPDQAEFYQELAEHPKVLKVVALSGGYSRELANAKLAENHGVIASFSRALSEDLSAQQTDEEFNATLDASVESIYQASIT